MSYAGEGSYRHAFLPQGDSHESILAAHWARYGMTTAELINWLITGTPSTLLALGIWAFFTGRLIAKPVHDAQMADKDEQIAQGVDREARLWKILETTAGLTERAGALAERATRVAERTAPTWTTTQADLERPRRPRTPKAAPP